MRLGQGETARAPRGSDAGVVVAVAGISGVVPRRASAGRGARGDSHRIPFRGLPPGSPCPEGMAGGTDV